MTKYVLANVEIPIQILEDGTIESMESYAKIHIIREIGSPEEITSNPAPVQEQIEKLFNEKESNNSVKEVEKIEEPKKEQEMMVLREEINAGYRSPLKNTSFKNKKVYKHNVSVKVRR
tara:strand:- start:296 stop:649 length:354 start_codon:yes stop_codon:yes gene_type:complete